MPTIVFVEANGTPHRVEAEPGRTVMQIAVDHGMPGIAGDCGGCCSCATCHAYVAPEWAGRLPPREEDEEMILENAPAVRPTSRLSCQLRFTPALDGLVIELPAV